MHVLWLTVGLQIMNHELWFHIQSHPIHAQLLSWFLDHDKNNIHKIMKLTKEDHAGLDMLNHCLRSIV